MRSVLVIASLVMALLGCAQGRVNVPFSPTATQKKIVEGARKQLAYGTVYYAAYVKIPYPNGDLPRNRGVCTDVVIRSLRHAGFDLQKLIHEDHKKRSYPRRERRGPDSNIDHRRCPNQMFFFRKYGKELTKTVSRETLKHWQPGDFVYWKLDGGADHTGVLSDRRNARGEPYVIHNLSTTLEEDVLTAWKIVGHFRYPK